MADVILVTRAMTLSADVLPGLTLLSHRVKVVQPDLGQLMHAQASDILFIDGRRDLAAARSFCRLVRTSGIDNSMLLITTEGGLAAVAADWGLDDVLVDTAAMTPYAISSDWATIAVGGFCISNSRSTAASAPRAVKSAWT